VAGGRSQLTLMRGGCGGLAGRVCSRYRGECWEKYGEVMSRSRTLRILQNAAKTTDVTSGVSWFVKKGRKLSLKMSTSMKLHICYVTVRDTDLTSAPGYGSFLTFKNRASYI
jgi:hypothetical protein